MPEYAFKQIPFTYSMAKSFPQEEAKTPYEKLCEKIESLTESGKISEGVKWYAQDIFKIINELRSDELILSENIEKK
jgi:hypothetical protein